MDFRMDAGQLELSDTVVRFCGEHFPLDRLGEREDAHLDRDAWSGLAEMGVFALLVDEADAGLGLVDAAIVFEQLGSHLVPTSVLWTTLAAPYIPGASRGEQVVSGSRADAVDDATALVDNAADVDLILVVDPTAARAHPTRELAAPVAVPGLDPLGSTGRFVDLGAGVVVASDADASRLWRRGTVLAAAMLVGLASRALETARAYALERHQFGVPIGSFQAVKHMLADMYLRSSLAQSATYAAAALDDSVGSDGHRAAAAAKALAGQAAIDNAAAAVQVLGGMGFTWEMLPHYLLKRAWGLGQEFGTADEHALELGRTLATTP